MYRVLYRKWRPRVFGDVVGQPQVTVTLSSQVRENRLAHAYLFTGSRGTGKTSCAKILSKAVNCLNPVNGDPCNECEICRGIDNGTVLDIVEIDAASNRGIDDIRLLRDEANFTPAKAKYRVYIIDEVHMLTIEAFNALLKTLEEPPEHVKFILATTEVHKLPSTILSRCQRFDFRRIEPEVIADRLTYIAQQEGAVLQPDAALLIARIADGGMRDALSLLDRALSADNNVTAEVVSASAGLMGRENIYSLCAAIAEKNTAAGLTLLDELHRASCDTERLITELTNQFRNFLIIKTVKKPEDLIICTADELNKLKSLASGFTDEEIIYALKVLTDSADAVKRTQNRRIEAEMAVIRLCHPAADNDVSALAARISALEEKIKMLSSGAAPVKISVPEKRPVTEPVKEPEKAPENVPPEFDIPAEELPFGSGETDGQTAFAGFANDVSGAYADKFDTGEEDDEPFDFDSFMSEYGSGQGKEKPADDTDKTAAVEGALDEKTWVRIILETERSFSPLVGLLTNSSAYIRGGQLLIRLADGKMRFMLDKDVLSKRVGPVAEKILGKNYEIRLED